jgi:uncharacterized protein YegJ (DUF2314 family)
MIAMRTIAMAAVIAAGACKGHRSPGTARAVPAPAPSPSIDAAPVAAPGARTIGARVAAGSLRGQAFDGYAVLVPSGESAETARRVAEREAAAHHLAATIEIRPRSESGLTPERLRYFGRGLSAADAAAIAKAHDAVTIMIAGPAEQVPEMVRGSAAVARSSAAAVHGWIEDLVTGETFSRAKLDETRPDHFALDVEHTVVVHQVSDDDGTAFLESFGMVRFGLPELYLRGVPRSFLEDATELFDAAAQTLVERGGLAHDGVIEVDVASLREGVWPGKHDALVKAGAPGKVTFTATWSLADQAGEPDAQPEIELSLPGGPVAEQLHAAIVGFSGARRDDVKGVAPDDAELDAARARAQKELAALAPHFAKGVPELERLLVKAPFRADGDGDGGLEWMWVEVHGWKGDRLTGILVNEPEHVSTLHEGARVEVHQQDLFDYLHTRADGTTAGGETNRILEGR